MDVLFKKMEKIFVIFEVRPTVEKFRLFIRWSKNYGTDTQAVNGAAE